MLNSTPVLSLFTWLFSFFKRFGVGAYFSFLQRLGECSTPLYQSSLLARRKIRKKRTIFLECTRYIKNCLESLTRRACVIFPIGYPETTSTSQPHTFLYGRDYKGEEAMTQATISRREFLKVAAAASIALSAPSNPLLISTDKAFADEATERIMHKTACHGCTNCCPVRVYTEDDVVVKIEGDPDGPLNKGGICLKCLSQIQTVYSPRHVLHPMKRFVERGQNKW